MKTDMESDGLPLRYAISNDKVVLVSASVRNIAYLAESFNQYPPLNNAATIQEKEAIAKEAFAAEGYKENVDFVFVPVEELKEEVDRYNQENCEKEEFEEAEGSAMEREEDCEEGMEL
ncbi:hypothetical protein [Desulfosporosinus sp. BG]|uniref:hypothetical protein n=1 Tax=Desulfosporosinus sp. BG TaxID=1633135 RepID=UPI000839DCAC|nr:hypothetical protein [Desulfosporosinus sp. BG]ODA40124.1 hypothetical protein DSBG_3069 [Desulfosporosinus sp. BG]